MIFFSEYFVIKNKGIGARAFQNSQWIPVVLYVKSLTCWLHFSDQKTKCVRVESTHNDMFGMCMNGITQYTVNKALTHILVDFEFLQCYDCLCSV